MDKYIIAYNAYTLNKPITGVGRYTQMLSYMDNIFKIGLCYNDNYCWDHSFNKIESSKFRSKFGKLYWNLFSNDLRTNYEILHSPYPSLPICRTKKSIITIHDLIFLSNPEWYSKSELFFIKKSLNFSVKAADHIICVSNSTKNNLLDYFPSLEKKTSVIYNCFPPANRIEYLKNNNKSHLSLFLNKKYKYFVCPSNRHPRKNLVNTIDGFKKSKFKSKGYKLVLTGLNESKFISPQNDFILDLGYLNDQDYYKLIKYSMGIIYFPYKEGFGLPILDAIMLNKNIFVSDISVFKEILPNHCMLDKIDNSNSITDYLDFMYKKNDQEVTIEKEKFSFKKFQENHLEVYKKVINEN